MCEQVHCGSCSRSSHQSSYTQFFYNVSATALRLQNSLNQADGAAPSLGTLLWVSHPSNPSPPISSAQLPHPTVYPLLGGFLIKCHQALDIQFGCL